MKAKITIEFDVSDYMNDTNLTIPEAEKEYIDEFEDMLNESQFDDYDSIKIEIE